MAQNQTSICGLRRISPSPKIKFGFTCQPRNPKVEAYGAPGSGPDHFATSFGLQSRSCSLVIDVGLLRSVVVKRYGGSFASVHLNAHHPGGVPGCTHLFMHARTLPYIDAE